MEEINLSLKSMDSLSSPLLKGSASFDAKLEEKQGFVAALGDAVENLKDLQNKSAELMQEYASGGDVDTAEVMIAMEKTSLATNLAIKVRNKFIDSYEEIMRMQL